MTAARSTTDSTADESLGSSEWPTTAPAASQASTTGSTGSELIGQRTPSRNGLTVTSSRPARGTLNRKWSESEAG